MLCYDPSEYIRGLQQLLVSDKKKIAFLCGAGTSLSKKTKKTVTVPAVQEMTQEIEAELKSTQEFSAAVDEIKQEIGENKFNIETLLSNIEEKRNIIGNGTLNGLNKKEFDDLAKTIKDSIRNIVSVHNQIKTQEDAANLVHVDFAEWIGKAERKFPVEIYTTNYDYLFEIGLEEKNIPYYDGFTGSYNPFFYSESVDNLSILSQQTKLWKIHGSLGWHFDQETSKVIRGNSNEKDILIYPSTLKYANSKKQPYIALMDRLTNYLKQPDSVLFVCGYSFGDEHINERIMTALKTNTTAHVFVFYYDICWNGKKKVYALTDSSPLTKLAKENSKLSVLGSRNAVLGCQYGKWKLKREPDKDDTININLYFDEDAPLDESDKIGEEKQGKEQWTGEGEFIITDFSKFVSFLQSMIYKDALLED